MIVKLATEIGTAVIGTAEIETVGIETGTVEDVIQDVAVEVRDVLVVEIEEETAVVVGVRDAVTLQAEEPLID